MTYAFSLIFFTIVVVAWIWSDHAERKDEQREARVMWRGPLDISGSLSLDDSDTALWPPASVWPQAPAWHIVSPPFDWKESEDL